MSFLFKLQDPGEGIHEAEILEIPVSQGQHVTEGDTVLVAETDKAAVDLPAPVSGQISEIRVQKGDLVHVGDVLIALDEDGAEDRADAGGDTDQSSEPDKAEKPAPDEQREPQENGGEQAERADESSDAGSQGARTTPAVRGVARKLGVNLDDMSGSGKDGRILEEDVRAAAGKQVDETQGNAEAIRGKREKLRSIRRATAQRVTRSWREIPHVTHHDVADITELERLRRKEASFVEKQGGKLTLSVLLIKALAAALRDHPRFNATFDSDHEELLIRDDINMGIAFDTQAGLLVPVVRDVGHKSVLDIALELNRLAERLASNRPSPDVLRDGTFTLTNIGVIGGTSFSPIINPPQVAIFGAARAHLATRSTGDLDDHETMTILALPISLTFDHRIADGADAARFMNRVKALLEDPSDLLIQA